MRRKEPDRRFVSLIEFLTRYRPDPDSKKEEPVDDEEWEEYADGESE